MNRHRAVGLIASLFLALALNPARPLALSLPRAVPQLVGDWWFDGEANGDLVGYAVGTAGDVDGDGYDDLAIGAPGQYSDPLYFKEGVVHVFYGSGGGLGDLPDWSHGGGQKAARFGEALASAGDVNDDGFDDLLIGAPDYNNGTTKAGAAMLFFGSSLGLPSTPAWTYVSPDREVQLGNAVSSGDLDADGYSDVIVASHWYSQTVQKEGAILIFYGSQYGLSSSPDLMLVGGQEGATFGQSVAAGGDVNGDGYDDLLAGAPLYDVDLPSQGAVFLYLGGPGGLEPAPAWTGYGPAAGAWFGSAVTWAGDTNKDGYDDLVVGAPGDSYRVLRGALYVFYGSATGPGPLPNATITVGQLNSGLGHSLARAGDMNGDGYDDVLAGAYRLEDDHRAEGAALLYFGSPTGLRITPDWVGWGEKADAAYGYGVGSAGLVNSTATRSIVVGAPDYMLLEKTPIGRAFVHYGPLELRPHRYTYLPLVVHLVQPEP